MQLRTCRAMGLAVALTALTFLVACSGSDPTSPSAGAGTGASAGTSGSGGGAAGAGAASGSGGGSGGSGGTAGGVKPCALITGAEAATALGLSAPLTAKTDTDTACEYQGPNEVDAVSIDVETEEYKPGTEDIVVNMLGKDTAKKVDGLGQAAFAFNLNFQVQYHIWAKGRYLLIVLSKQDTANLDAPAKIIAQTAVSRL